MRKTLCTLLVAILLIPALAFAAPAEGVKIESFEQFTSGFLDLIGSSLTVDEKTIEFTQVKGDDGVVTLSLSRESFDILGYTFPDSDIIDTICYLPNGADATADSFFLLSFICGIMKEKVSLSSLEKAAANLETAQAQLTEGSSYGTYNDNNYTSYIWSKSGSANIFYLLHQHDDSTLSGSSFQDRFGIAHPTEIVDTPPTMTPEATPTPEAANVTSTQAPEEGETVLVPDASFDFSALSDQDLLTFWESVGTALQERGAYPYIELSKGDQGIDVTRLQQRLADLFYYSKDLTGKYDDATVKAVKAFEKDNGIKGDGTMSIDEQNLLYSDSVSPKATPTPTPTPTPAPTPLPDHVILEITGVTLRDRRNTKTFSVSLRNRSSEYTIDAFTVAYRVYDTYGDLLSSTFLNDGIEYAEWWKDLKIKPNGKFSMGSYYWYLFGDQTASRIEVAISKYHTTDGKTVEILPENYTWVEGNLK